MIRAVRIVIALGTLVLLCEARPGFLRWNVAPYHDRESKHNIPEFNPDNGAFFYPDEEFIDKRSRDTKSHHDSGDADDFSGWQALNDDEDFEKQNTIPSLARDPVYDRLNYENGPMNEFGPDNIIHDVFPHYDHKQRNSQHVLEEEHFGNEINDIDKIDELTRRMEKMQREMRKMQHMLAKQKFRPRW